MKPFKAPGLDGWRAQELQRLPFRAIEDLASIFHVIWPTNLTATQMLARVILLAKTPNPETFSDGRPITILGYIPRLTSKLVADQLLREWGKSWDPQIAGGLPFRAVKDITIQQQYILEKAHTSNTPYGGFTLDLTKAFNLIPRQIARQLLIHFGAPDNAIGFWIRSLNEMQRMLQTRQGFSHSYPSTTGAPEGDSLSVCAMLAASYCSSLFPSYGTSSCYPFTYADNWTFLSTSERNLFRAVRTTLNFTHALRMKVDIRESWGWGTTKSMRDFWGHMRHLFPASSLEISVHHSAKDLGCTMQYTKQCVLGCLKDRMASASRRLTRLGRHNLTIDERASKIQMAIWPLAFYAAESQFIGESHFVKLLRQATDVLIGKHKYASSMLALSILSSKVDPMLYGISTAICSFRRLFQYHYQLATEMWHHVVHRDTKCGPCAALGKYLDRVNWQPMVNAMLELPDGQQVCICAHSPSEIRRAPRSAWVFYVYDHIQHRKGVTHTPFDPYIQHKINHKLSDQTRKLIGLYLTGGYQTNAVKSLWDSTQNALCTYCDQPDTHSHRQLECVHFQRVRDRHPEAVRLLQTFPNLLWFPVATVHAKQIPYNLLKSIRQGPFLDIPNIAPSSHHVFYTDGSCDRPKLQNCCRAAWAVVQHVNSITQDPSVNDFVVTQSSHVAGTQTIHRGELGAIAWLARHFTESRPNQFMSIYTDSDYALRLVEAIASNTLDPKTFQKSHTDLIQQLLQCWNPLFYQIRKVKSHRNLEDAVDLDDLYTILGNDLADQVAKKINQLDVPPFQDAAEAVFRHSLNQIDALTLIYQYLADLNSLHSNLKIEKETNAASEHQHNTLDAYANFQLALCQWDVGPACWSLDVDLPEVVAQGCPVGASVAYKVWKMFHTFRWQPHEAPVATGDFGITGYELALYYALFTGTCLPIWIYHTANKLPRPYAFDSPEAKIQPDSKNVFGIKQGFYAPWYDTLKIPCNVPFFHDTRRPTLVHWFDLDSIEV